MLRIEHLTKTYDSRKAVDDLTLHIAPGEVYGFIGLNGAGKTTTLKSVAGILQFDSGEIYVAGKSVREDPTACKTIMAYIPDNPDLYDFMTGTQYLNFVGDIFGVSTQKRKERIGKYAEIFGLTADLDQSVSSYSHGMKQKLAVISAWMHEPKLILMDEPFVGLDPKASHSLKEMMRELCDEGGAISSPPTCWTWRKSCVTKLPLSKKESSSVPEPWKRLRVTNPWRKPSWNWRRM